MLTLRLIMPSTGDMSLLKQEGGTIDLAPYFYSGESMGPHLQLVDMPEESDKSGRAPEVLVSYRVKVKKNKKLIVMRGE